MECKIVHRISDETGIKFITNWDMKSKKIAEQTLKADLDFILANDRYENVRYANGKIEYTKDDEYNELYIMEVE